MGKGTDMAKMVMNNMNAKMGINKEKPMKKKAMKKAKKGMKKKAKMPMKKGGY